MEIVAGILVAIAIAGLAHGYRLERSRRFYPVLLIIIAVFYIGFAVLSGNPTTLLYESLFAFVFIIIALIALRAKKKIALIIGLGLIAHGAFDLVHDQVINNNAVPLWWPHFCAAVDIGLGIWLLYLEKNHTASAH